MTPSALILAFALASAAWAAEPPRQEKPVTGEPIPATVRIAERTVRGPATPMLLGFNHDWNTQVGVLKAAPDSLGRVLGGLPMPLNRVAGTESGYLRWKGAIGPRAERTPQALSKNQQPAIVEIGPIEWIMAVRAADPKARFAWVPNLVLDQPQDHADLAAFLTGTTGPWAERRIALGVAEPLDVAVWELGNELDWGGHKMPVADYVARCKAAIAAIRSVQPKAVFAAHATTAVHEYKDDAWRQWHRTVLREIGQDLSCLAFHSYYQGIPTAQVERYMDVIAADCREILGGRSLPFFISEHAKWPPVIPGKPWQEQWYQTHALLGCLDTAQWMARMYARGDVAFQTYHSFSSGPWGVVYRDAASATVYPTAMADLFRIFHQALGPEVVACEVGGALTDATRGDLALTVLAFRQGAGLTVLLVNRSENTPRAVSFAFEGAWRVAQESRFGAEGLHDFNTATSRPVGLREVPVASTGALTTYLMPAKTVAVLHLAPQESRQP